MRFLPADNAVRQHMRHIGCSEAFELGSVKCAGHAARATSQATILTAGRICSLATQINGALSGSQQRWDHEC